MKLAEYERLIRQQSVTTFLVPGGITVGQLATIYGVSSPIQRPFNPYARPGRRSMNKALRKAIAHKINLWGKISEITGRAYTIHDESNLQPLTAETVLMFTRLTGHVPTYEEWQSITKYKTFELWFALVYNGELDPNKPLEESVFYSESEAGKVFRSLSL